MVSTQENGIVIYAALPIKASTGVHDTSDMYRVDNVSYGSSNSG